MAAYRQLEDEYLALRRLAKDKAMLIAATDDNDLADKCPKRGKCGSECLFLDSVKMFGIDVPATNKQEAEYEMRKLRRKQ